MADLICTADGNFTAAATWALVDSTSKLIATGTTAQALTTGNLDTQTFTPGAITVDGIALRLASRATGSPTNTLTVTLRNSTDALDVVTTVINVSDLPSCSTADEEGGWFFVKFASSQLLVAGKAYLVRCALSSTSTAVNLFRDGTSANWQRMLRTTTTQAPAAGDDLHIMGEYAGGGGITSRSVTMDQTATTDYGSANNALRIPAFTISKGGTLAYGTTSATNYYLRISGHMIVYSGGTFTVGTVATPVPRDATAVLEFDSTNTSQTTGSFGLTVFNAGTFTAQGLSRTSGKNIYSCLLNTDEAAGQTTLGVDTDTGWLDTDVIAIASTSRTQSESEERTLSGAAGASSLTISAGLTYAHGGTAPVQAEVILLTRNVKIRTNNSSYPGYINVWDTATVDIDWVEFRYMGANTPVAAVLCATTGTGSCSVQYCSSRDTFGYFFYANQSDANNFTFRYNVAYSVGGNLSNVLVSVVATSGTNWTIADNTVVRGSNGVTGFSFSDLGGSCSRNRAAGVGVGFYIAADDAAFGDFDDNIVHSCASTGVNWTANTLTRRTISRLASWRNNGIGIVLTGPGATVSAWRQVQFVDLVAFGNLTSNVDLSGYFDKCVASGWVVSADTTFAVTNGVIWSGANYKVAEWRFNNCDFGVATGIKAAHTNDFNFNSGISRFLFEFWDCRFGSTNEWANLSSANFGTAVRSSRHDGTATRYKSTFWEGTVEDEQTIYNSAAPSVKMTPSANAIAAFRFEGVRSYAAVNNAGTVTFSVRVRKDASYAGSAPRLVMKANPALGLDADVVLDTHTAAADTWEELTGTTAAASGDGVIEAVVDCDGSAGAVYVDDFTVV